MTEPMSDANTVAIVAIDGGPGQPRGMFSNIIMATVIVKNSHCQQYI
jgi:hypothetical protein